MWAACWNSMVPASLAAVPFVCKVVEFVEFGAATWPITLSSPLLIISWMNLSVDWARLGTILRWATSCRLLDILFALAFEDMKIMWALKVTVTQTAQGSCVGFPFPFCGWLLGRGLHLSLFINVCLGYFSTVLSVVWLPELGMLIQRTTTTGRLCHWRQNLGTLKLHSYSSERTQMSTPKAATRAPHWRGQLLEGSMILLTICWLLTESI